MLSVVNLGGRGGESQNASIHIKSASGICICFKAIKTLNADLHGFARIQCLFPLDLSTYTVETHRTNLMHTLNLHNTAEIVLYAVRKKIIA
jgi:hypothetical protein